MMIKIVMMMLMLMMMTIVKNTGTIKCIANFLLLLKFFSATSFV